MEINFSLQGWKKFQKSWKKLLTFQDGFARIHLALRHCGRHRRSEVDPERYRSGHNEAVLKTVCPKGRVGSNPTLSARSKAAANMMAGENPHYHLIQLKSWRSISKWRSTQEAEGTPLERVQVVNSGARVQIPPSPFDGCKKNFGNLEKRNKKVLDKRQTSGYNNQALRGKHQKLPKSRTVKKTGRQWKNSTLTNKQ